MLDFHVDEERCILCGDCVADCPARVLTMEEYPVMAAEGCYQCQHCLAICPTGALSILGKDPDQSQILADHLPDADQVGLLIRGRRSVRQYAAEDLPEAVIDDLLNTACHAPTGVNAQSVLFTVVRERRVLDALRLEIMERLGRLQDEGRMPDGIAGRYLGWTLQAWHERGEDVMFRGAPHLVVTSASTSAPCHGQDPLIALTTFDLYAQARGVGTVWDGIFMMALAVCPELKARLGIPEDHAIGYAMAFGQPSVGYVRTVQRGPATVNVVRL